MYPTFHQDPDATLDYQIDWEEWLGGDTISTSTWEVPTGLTKDSDGKTSTTTNVWLSVNNTGTHLVSNTIETDGGRTQVQSFYIKVQDQ